MGLEEAAAALATAIVGTDSVLAPRGEEESLHSYAARRRTWQHRTAVYKALVEFGKMCQKGDRDESRER